MFEPLVKKASTIANALIILLWTVISWVYKWRRWPADPIYTYIIAISPPFCLKLDKTLQAYRSHQNETESFSVILILLGVSKGQSCNYF